MPDFDWAHEEEIDLSVNIDWSKPVTHDMLNTGLVTSDDEAYYYAIIGLFDGEWSPYYIGMVFSRNVSARHKDQDHRERLDRLKELYPETTWHLTLGTPTANVKRLTKKVIEKVEGLLIYSHWHDESVNDSKINGFFDNSYICITNSGFTEPFYSKIGFGAFVAE